MLTIDLNSDLGEHPNSNLDEQIMPYISSCNIACGGHVGDTESVKITVDLAIMNNASIGAHPSFPDKINFGRKVLEMEHSTLRSSLKEQIILVKTIAENAGQKLHHVKPHGALYNLAAANFEMSELICNLLHEIDPEIMLYGLAHSETEKAAATLNIKFVGEAFADRRYEMDKTLRSRKHADAVFTKKEDVLQQVENIVLKKGIVSENWIDISAQTICLHSDTQGAVHLAKAIRNHLEQKGVHISAV